MSELPEEPLDLTLREILAVYNASVDSDIDETDIVDQFGKPASLVIQDIFSEIHPANASHILHDISKGLDDGFTAQGSYHPDFQRAVNAIQKDPDDLYD